MFIIFGSPRSGTTLLSATLHLHDQIVVPDETDFLIPTAFIVDRVKDERTGKRLIADLITSSERFQRSLGEYLSPRDVRRAVRSAEYSSSGIIQAVYAKLAERAGKSLPGDKSPNDLNFLRILIKTGFMQSPIKVIHLVRDLRDVIVSLMNVGWDTAGIETWFPRFWCQGNLYLRELFADQPERYCLIRYEDLVAQPEEHVRRVTEFLGVEFQAKMLDHSQRGQRYAGVADHRHLQEPFLPQRAQAWRGKLSPQVEQLCQTQAGEALVAFGYGEPAPRAEASDAG